MKFYLSQNILYMLDIDKQLQYIHEKTNKYIAADRKPEQNIMDFEKVVSTSYLHDVRQVVAAVQKIFDQLQISSVTLKEITKGENI